MISGNVPINSQTVIQSAVNGTSLFNAVFASRLVKQEVRDGNTPGLLHDMMTSDPERAQLLKELEDDGGKASLKKIPGKTRLSASCSGTISYWSSGQ